MSYEDNLERALSAAPDTEGSGERFDVPEPDVREEGNVTVYENFPGTVDLLDRDPAHVMKFLQTELGTSATIDETGRLRLTGSFRAARVGEALDAYVEGYVVCPECGLPDTHFEREGGALLLKCTACGARSATGS